MTRYAQLNVGRGKATTAELLETIQRMQIDVVLVQEPYLWGPTRGFSGGRLVQKGPESKACIFVANAELGVLHLSHLSSDLTSVAEITDTSGNSTIIISSYFQYGLPTDTCVEEIDGILSSCSDKHFIIGADVNAQSLLWAPEVPQRHNCPGLEELIARRELVVANDAESPPTFLHSNGSSHIDVTLTSHGLSNRVIDWKVHPNISMSDHRLITYTLTSTPRICTPGTAPGLITRFKTKGANFENFDITFTRKLDRSARCPVEDIHLDVARLMTDITKTAEDKLGRTTPRQADLASWWKPRLSSLRKRFRRARRAYQEARKRQGSPLNADDPVAILFRASRLKLKKAINKAKSDHFREFVSEMGGFNPWGPPFRAVKFSNRRGNIVTAIERPNGGGLTSNAEDTASVLIDALIPQDNPDLDDNQFAQVRILARLPLDTPHSTAPSLHEIGMIINNLPTGKAPGPDCIDSVLAQRAWLLASHELTKLYSNCMKRGIFPDCWKKGLIVVIPKISSRPPSDPKAYRPITLLPILGKVLEKLMCSRIESHLTENCPISERQFGFRPGKSTEDAMRFVLNSVETSCKQYVIGIFLDIAGAFDTAWWPLVLKKLRLRQIPGNLYAMIQSYFSNREITYNSGQTSISRKTTMGCPQGSVLGPLLWNILFDDLLTLSLPPDCTIIAYADDALLIVGANSRAGLERASTGALANILNWGKANRLSFAPAKTESLLLKGGTKLDILKRSPHIRMELASIRVLKQVKYLGVILDDKLSFQQHAKTVVNKANLAYLRISRLAGKNWGLKPRALKIAYGAIFIGIAGYASSVWHHRTNISFVKKTLLSGQRLALISLTKAYRTTSTDALPVLAGVLPLDLHIQLRGAITLLMKGIDTSIGSVQIAVPSRRETPEGHTYRSFVGKLVLTTVVAIWQTRWAASSKGRQTYQFFPDVSWRLAIKSLTPSHWTCQFLTGHGKFNAKLFALGKLVLRPDCSCGYAEQDVNHVLWDCPEMESERAELFAVVRPHTGPIGHADLIATKANFTAFEKFANLYGDRHNLDSSLESFNSSTSTSSQYTDYTQDT